MRETKAQARRILDSQKNINKLFKKLLKGHQGSAYEQGAVDLNSILVGLIILTVIASLIATTVYVIIPWSRDQLAKWQLSEVANAEAAYAGLTLSGSSTSGSLFAILAPKYTGAPTNSYGSLRQLITAGTFPSSYLGDGSEEYLSNNNMLCVVPMSSGAGYQAAVLSDTGNMYAIDQTNHNPVKVADGNAVCNGTVLGPVEPDPNTATATATPTPTDTASPATTGAASAPTATATASPTPTPTLTAAAAPTDSPTPTPTASPAPTSAAAPSATSAPTATPSPSSNATDPSVPSTGDPVLPLPNQDPNANTRKFMYCHNGHMISTSYAGMLNGHTGMNFDIIPPVPSYGYPGWNWTPDTAKIYYNDCKPLS